MELPHSTCVLCHADCNANTAYATVTLKYVAPPKAVADSYNYPGGSFTLVDSAATRGILFNDLNPSCPATPLTPVVTNPTAKGTIALTTNGGFTYVPNANVAPGDDVFTYEVTGELPPMSTAHDWNLGAVLISALLGPSPRMMSAVER
jgi:hypothetical protein